MPSAQNKAIESSDNSQWQASLQEVLHDDIRQGFASAFPASYQHDFSIETALSDIALCQQLSDNQPVAMQLYRYDNDSAEWLRFKIVNRDSAIALSDILPILENFGLRVLGERPYPIVVSDSEQYWLHDFELSYPAGVPNIEKAAELFETAFRNVWQGHAESDQFNALVFSASLDWRSVVMLRAYARYIKQIALPYTRPYIASTLVGHSGIAQQLCELFAARFNPVTGSELEQRELEARVAQEQIEQALEEVSNLTEDQIVRQYLTLINATLRTNFYQCDENGEQYDYLSLKLDVNSIPEAPKPKPKYEVFVYSPEVEGVHLRGGKVARGGLRWSDRQEDFRTEILGLVKAQQVKNSVIVPMGAKGGFICKQPLSNPDRAAIQAQGVACYRTFISALLEITDNLVEGNVQPPEQVVRWDGDDPYLVVAADKGTATFSDIANEISQAHGFWLGDAFASGGSVGYDHKKMGITARGAWVSVQRHFREMGVDVQSEDFSVVAVGDMGGDVFGNGMLSSEHICLKAAFNHLHIFIDPNPNAATTFQERQRLFNADASGWDQFNKELISEGGGVFSRSAKSIALNAQIKQSFGIEADELTPNELIRAILQSKVDLFWNGGIGTYVKAASETDADVGDRATDALRVNGAEFGAKVIGEGGNLGCTQLGRVEYALNGGRCNTDFIDNAGGVDCSDHEVNIKILLQQVIQAGQIDEAQRVESLDAMTDEVAELVLHNNYRQAQAISLAETEADLRSVEYQRLISYFEQQGILDRALEFIPTDEALQERRSYGNNLTRPELSVLVSYAKLSLKQALAQSDIASDTYVAGIAATAFPESLVASYPEQVDAHQLHSEIVATQLANEIVNRMGITFVHRMQEATGECEATVAKAYLTCRELFDIESHWQAIEALDHKVDAELQYDMYVQLIRLVRRSTRWLLRECRSQIAVEHELETYRPAASYITSSIDELMQGEQLAEWQQKIQSYIDAGVPAELAQFVATARYCYTTFSIANAAHNTAASIDEVAHSYSLLGDKLELNWFADQIMRMGVESYWTAMARESFRDELEQQHGALVQAVVSANASGSYETSVDEWLDAQQAYVDRWQSMTAELRSVSEMDLAMFPVALRELVDLSQSAEKNFHLDD